MTLANLKDKLIRRALMKAASIKAVEGVITWPVRTNVNTAMNTATILEVNRELSIVDRKAFFFSRMEISLLKDRGYKRTNQDRKHFGVIWGPLCVATILLMISHLYWN